YVSLSSGGQGLRLLRLVQRTGLEGAGGIDGVLALDRLQHLLIGADDERHPVRMVAVLHPESLRRLSLGIRPQREGKGEALREPLLRLDGRSGDAEADI